MLVLKPSSFGDIIHTLPAVAWMKRVHPEWKVSWLVNAEWAPLLTGNSDLDEVVSFPRQEFRGLSGTFRLGRWLRRGLPMPTPDLAVDFQGLLRTALLAKWSGARTVYGLADAREGATLFYQRCATAPGGTPHAVERYLALAAEVLDLGSHPPPMMEFPLPVGHPPVGAEDLPGRRYVLLHPFSRGRGKSLSTGQLTQLCDNFDSSEILVLVGRKPGGVEIQVPARCKNFLNSTNISQLIWLLRNASFVVSVDSGPAHLAAALKCPMVAIHTWSDPRKVGPYREDAWVWKNGRLFRFSERHAQSELFYQETPGMLQGSDLAGIASLAGYLPHPAV